MQELPFDRWDRCPQDIPGIPVDVSYSFILGDLVDVWPQLRRLGFDTQQIAAKMWAEHKAQCSDGERISEGYFFLTYGLTVIQPRMNQALNRAADHPTFVKMMRHALRHKISRSIQQLP